MVSNNGSMLYTRAGAFKTDDEGYVINSEGITCKVMESTQW